MLAEAPGSVAIAQYTRHVGGAWGASGTLFNNEPILQEFICKIKTKTNCLAFMQSNTHVKDETLRHVS